ncbi:MAG: hypothetical protein GY938_12925 [Ketobacter sp.]|nr:hypothetical protein [Ketobacter sp.]
MKAPKWVGLALEILGSVGFIVQAIILFYGLEFQVEGIITWVGSVLGSGLITVSGMVTVLGVYLSGRSFPLWGKGDTPSWVPVVLASLGGIGAVITGLLAFYGINFDSTMIIDFLTSVLGQGAIGFTQLLTLIGSYLGNLQIPIFGDNAE